MLLTTGTLGRGGTLAGIGPMVLTLRQCVTRCQHPELACTRV